LFHVETNNAVDSVKRGGIKERGKEVSPEVTVRNELRLLLGGRHRLSYCQGLSLRSEKKKEMGLAGVCGTSSAHASSASTEGK